MNIHKGVLHRVGSLVINAVLSVPREEFSLLHLIGPDALCNPDHPEELVDVVPRVAQEAAKDDQNVVDLVLAHDGVADFLARAHGFSNSGNVRVVPGIIVHERGAISHATNLVAIIPPRHDFGVLLGVLAQPLVGFTVVVNDVLTSVWHAASQDNRRRRVGVRGHPGAVQDKQDEIHRKGSRNNSLGEIAVNADDRVLFAPGFDLGS